MFKLIQVPLVALVSEAVQFSQRYTVHRHHQQLNVSHCIQLIGPSCSRVAWADMQICGHPMVEHQVLKHLKHLQIDQLSAGSDFDHTADLLQKCVTCLFGVSGNMRPAGRTHHRPSMATEMRFSRLIARRNNEKHVNSCQFLSILVSILVTCHFWVRRTCFWNGAVRFTAHLGPRPSPKEQIAWPQRWNPGPGSPLACYWVYYVSIYFHMFTMFAGSSRSMSE